MPGLVCYMYTETFADRNFDRLQLADFALTILRCYRDNPYHNAEHAFCFTHTMYLVLVNNSGYFDFVEVSEFPSRDPSKISLPFSILIFKNQYAPKFRDRSASFLNAVPNPLSSGVEFVIWQRLVLFLEIP